MKKNLGRAIKAGLITGFGVVFSISGIFYLKLIEQVLVYTLLRPESFFTNKMLFTLLVFFFINGFIAYYWLTIGVTTLWHGIKKLREELNNTPPQTKT